MSLESQIQIQKKNPQNVWVEAVIYCVYNGWMLFSKLIKIFWFTLTLLIPQTILWALHLVFSNKFLEILIHWAYNISHIFHLILKELWSLPKEMNFQAEIQ